jgi:hypothetical protein
MRRFLVLLAGGAFLSLTAATEPATPEESASDAAAAEASAPADPAAAPASDAQQLVFTGDEGASTESAADAAAALPPPAPATAFARDMAAAKLQFKQRLAELTAAFQAEKDPARSIALQRQIQQLKLDTEIGYLELQGSHARAAGNTALADEAETLVRALREQLSAPTADATPQSNDGGNAGTRN